MKHIAWTVALALAMTAPAQAQESYDGPVIDMHSHATVNADRIEPIGPWLEKFDEFNVRKIVLTSYPRSLEQWVPQDPQRLLPALQMPCISILGEDCFPDHAVFPDIAWLEQKMQSGKVAILGEILTQLIGIAPDDERLSAYFTLAERYDVPVALHMGPGPMWAVTEKPIYEVLPNYSIEAGEPKRLEAVLRKHPKLRVYIMHAAWPMIDELLTLLWHNPNVYVDTGHLQFAIERAEYYRYLERLVSAGFGKRIMFGSDHALETYGLGIQAILDAEFLSEQQKSDILYNNAARFLRLSEEEIVGHHEAATHQ